MYLQRHIRSCWITFSQILPSRVSKSAIYKLYTVLFAWRTLLNSSQAKLKFSRPPSDIGPAVPFTVKNLGRQNVYSGHLGGYILWRDTCNPCPHTTNARVQKIVWGFLIWANWPIASVSRSSYGIKICRFLEHAMHSRAILTTESSPAPAFFSCFSSVCLSISSRFEGGSCITMYGVDSSWPVVLTVGLRWQVMESD